MNQEQSHIFFFTYEDPSWVDEMEELISSVPRIEPVKALVARPGSLWVSVLTNRRGHVLWASESHVCLSFSNRGSVTHRAEAFLRLYSPVS